MSSTFLEQGTTSKSYAPHPLKIIIFDVQSNFSLFTSPPFGLPDVMNQIYRPDRLWYVTENLYNLALEVDLDIPKGLHIDTLSIFQISFLFSILLTFFWILEEREVVKTIFDSPSLPTSTDGSITSLPRTEIETFGHAHQQTFTGLHSIGMVCASTRVENHVLRFRSFTIHDNAMCSVCLLSYSV